MIRVPQTPVYFGDVSATDILIFARFRAHPFRATNVEMWVDSDTTFDGTDYWTVEVMKLDRDGEEVTSLSWTSLANKGLKAYSPFEVLAGTSWESARLLGLKVTKKNSGAALTGLTVAYGLEGK